MVAPAYTTDLTTMDDAQSSTGWAEATASGWTSVFAVTGGETDDFIQNNACNSTTVKTGVGTLLYNNGSGITLNTDDAVLVWMKWDVSPSLATEASGGIRTVQGSSLSDFYAFTHLGSDSYIYGGWRNLATGDRADSEITEDYTAGSPSTTKQYHGWAFNALSVPSKGNPYKVDAIRYGRCEIRVNGGETADYATFAGMATENDLNVTTFNRWGLFQAVPGGYLWKGLMTLGYTSAVDFRDSATNISVDDTKHVTRNFNKIEIRQASSRVDWTGVNFVALGTKSPGRLEVIDNADVNLSSCSFNDMDTFTFLSNSAALSCNWARCGLITLGEADISGSSILESAVDADEGAVFDDRTTTVATDISELDNCTFTQGTNAHHAIRFGANVNDDITLTGIEFTGFSSVADAAGATLRFDATSGTMTCNLVDCTVDGAAATTSNVGVDDAAGITVTLAVSVPVSVTIIDEAGDPIENVQTSVYLTSDDSQVMNTDTNASGVASASFGGTTPAPCYIRWRKSSTGTTRYFSDSATGTIASSTGLSVQFVMKTDTIASS